MSEEVLDDREALPIDEIVRRLPKYFTMSVASKRNSGKSHLIGQTVKYLIKKKRVDIVVIMSGTAGLNHDWDFINPHLVMPYTDEMLLNICNRQKADKLNPKVKDVKHILVVLDDCLNDPHAVKSPVIQEVYSNGRQFFVSMIIISQHTSQLLTTIIRGNSDILVWSKLNRQQLEALWQSTTNIDKKDFIHMSETLAGHDYRFMLLDNYIQSRDPEDFLTVVRADP